MNPKGEIQDSEPSSETSSLSPYRRLCSNLGDSVSCSSMETVPLVFWRETHPSYPPASLSPPLHYMIVPQIWVKRALLHLLL